MEELEKNEKAESSHAIRERIMKAREFQKERFVERNFQFNADMGPEEIALYCKLGDAEREFMYKMFRKMEMSARAYHKILKVARTIADLEGEENIMEKHLCEAVCFRSIDRRYC